jgi:hypothetical protein
MDQKDFLIVEPTRKQEKMLPLTNCYLCSGIKDLLTTLSKEQKMKKHMMAIGLLLSFSTAVLAEDTTCLTPEELLKLNKDGNLKNNAKIYGKWTVKFQGFLPEEITSISVPNDAREGFSHICQYTASNEKGSTRQFTLTEATRR